MDRRSRGARRWGLHQPERCANEREIELPGPLEMTATYVDAQLTVLLTWISAREDRDTVRAHAHLALTVLTSPNSIDGGRPHRREALQA
jgi:hypothetical protein